MGRIRAVGGLSVAGTFQLLSRLQERGAGGGEILGEAAHHGHSVLIRTECGRIADGGRELIFESRQRALEPSLRPWTEFRVVQMA
jgi:hypothetical protein